MTVCVINMVQKNLQPIPPDNLEEVLKRDALYSAVGLAAFDLYDEVRSPIITGVIKVKRMARDKI